MVNNNNLVPIEAKKPVETVYELKNEIPSFEEFMKTYEADGNLNYADLNGGSVGETGGYGPCPDGCFINSSGDHVYYKTPETSRSIFRLEVECLNWGGGGGSSNYIYSTLGALEHARELERGKYFNVSSEVELKCAILIRDAVRYYERGNQVDGYVKVQGKF